jgi:putative hydrolase of the HAD superfamily
MARGRHAVTSIGFDADDTLWQNEQFFRLTEDRFADLLSDYADGASIRRNLIETERRNLAFYGYGIKGFTLSMIETAIDLTQARVPAQAIGEILSAGRAMLNHPIETLAHARETLELLAADYRIVLITKGDLFDQERKLAQSGLGEYFAAVEIVSEKTEATYRSVFARHADGPERAMMVGNSLKSDILPAIAAGSFGVHVPHDMTWALEHEEPPAGESRFFTIAHLGELPALLGSLD